MARRELRSHRGAPRGRGRPQKLLEADAQVRLLDAIRGGTPLGQAAVYAGVHERTLYRTITRGDDASVRAEEGQELDPDEEACRVLYERIREARAQVAVRNVALLQKAAQGGYVVETTTREYRDVDGNRVRETTERRAPPEWRAALALLTRSFPRDFGSGAQQVEIITPYPGAGGGEQGGPAGGQPSLHALTGIAAKLATHTAQAAADADAVLDAELVDDDVEVLADDEDLAR